MLLNVKVVIKHGTELIYTTNQLIVNSIYDSISDDALKTVFLLHMLREYVGLLQMTERFFNVWINLQTALTKQKYPKHVIKMALNKSTASGAIYARSPILKNKCYTNFLYFC